MTDEVETVDPVQAISEEDFRRAVLGMVAQMNWLCQQVHGLMTVASTFPPFRAQLQRMNNG